ncbi:MAG: hypothetical protein H7Y08_11520 [Rhizobiaceae bacterium]|nr:hypothetical protein [Rhizobiaceae bacterium]
MTSYLIELVLFTALVITSLKTGRMVLELRRLRTEEASFRQSLVDAEAAINRAAHEVVMLRSEGIATIAALDAAIREGRALAERLDDAVRMAEIRQSVANDALPAESQGGGRVAPAAPTQENWLSLIESRLTSASAVNR